MSDNQTQTNKNLPAAEVSFSLKLNPSELAQLDGKCSPDVQETVNLLRKSAQIADKHNVPLSWGMFAAKAVKAAERDGILICRPVSMVRCEVTGKRAERRMITRGRDKGLEQDIPFSGFELSDRFIQMQNHPNIGIAGDAISAMSPILIDVLRDVRAEISEKLTGEPPRFKKEKILRHDACDWEGPEHQAFTINKFHLPNTSGCPCCNKSSSMSFGLLKNTGRSVVTPISEIEAATMERETRRKQEIEAHHSGPDNERSGRMKASI
jgi:hypothetical protein